MADFDEHVLFEQADVTVTTERLILRGQASYSITDFVSAEAGHYEPRAVEWVGMVGGGALVLAVFDAVMVITQIPTGEMPGPLEPIPPEIGWRGAALLAAFGIIGMMLYYILRYIWIRHIVRVETTSCESRIIFRSRDGTLVKHTARAISKAIARHGRETAALQFDT